MAGNKKVYQEAMRQGYSAAWEKRWLDAVNYYKRALAEFPADIDALNALAGTYLQLNRLGEALSLYEKVRQLAPGDLVSLSKMADVQIRQGRRESALASLNTLATCYRQQNLESRALEIYERMVSLAPENQEVLQSLAEAYKRANHPALAVRAYLQLARLCRQNGEIPQMRQYAEIALSIEPTNPEAADFLKETGPAAAALQARPTPTVPSEMTATELVAQEAIARLADQVLEAAPAVAGGERQKRDLDLLLGRALAAQAAGDTTAAMREYEAALRAGADRPEVRYNLGLLYLKAGRHEEAIPHLTQTANIPDYAVGSLYALGQCHQAAGRLDMAMDCYVKAASQVDMETVGQDKVDDVIDLYRSLAAGYEVKGNREAAVAALSSLVNALTRRGWASKADRLSELLPTTAGPAAPEAAEQPVSGQTMVEIEVPDESRRPLLALTASGEYLSSGLYLAAIEECHQVIEFAPTYLPIHERLAEIYIKQGWLDQAAAKYTVMAAYQAAMGDLPAAEAQVRRALEILPQDTDARSRLADILVAQGKQKEAIPILDALGESQLEAGLYDAAIATVERIITLNPPNIAAYRQVLNQIKMMAMQPRV